MRLSTLFFRSLYGVLFFAGVLIVFLSIDYNLFNITLVLDLPQMVIVVFNLVMMVVGFVATMILDAIATALSGLIPGVVVTPNVGEQIFQIFLAVTNIILPHTPMTTLLFSDPLGFGGTAIATIATTVVLVLLPVAVLSGLGFLRDGNTTLAIVSFVGLQTILAVAVFTGFWPSEPFWMIMNLVTFPLSVLAGELLFPTTASLLEVNTSNLFSMLLSPMFMIGFLLYLVLEVAFQTSYALNIIEPMVQREERITKRLKTIREFVPEVTSGVGEKKIRSTATGKKYNVLAASYLQELVERKVFKRGDQALDDKSSMRLQSYLASLERTNPATEETLTARSAMPSARAIAIYIIPTMIFRVVLVVLLSWIVVNPTGIFFGNDLLAQFFFGGAIANSLELYEPEFRTLILFNVGLVIVVLGYITHWLATRRAKLEIAEVKRIETIVEFERYATEGTDEAPESEGETPG